MEGLKISNEFESVTFFKLNLDKLLVYGKDTTYYNIIYEGIHIGYVGYADKIGRKYAQIFIFKEKRGLVKLKKIYQLLCEKDNITELYGRVDDNNKVSMKAHLEAGFKLIETYHIGVFKPK